MNVLDELIKSKMYRVVVVFLNKSDQIDDVNNIIKLMKSLLVHGAPLTFKEHHLIAKDSTRGISFEIAYHSSAKSKLVMKTVLQALETYSWAQGAIRTFGLVDLGLHPAIGSDKRRPESVSCHTLNINEYNLDITRYLP